MWAGVCGLCHPYELSPGRWDGDTKSWMGLGQLAVPRLAPLVSGRGRRWPGENSADSWGKDGELSLVIQLPRQIKTQDMGAYLGSVKQEKAERD